MRHLPRPIIGRFVAGRRMKHGQSLPFSATAMKYRPAVRQEQTACPCCRLKNVFREDAEETNLSREEKGRSVKSARVLYCESP